MVSRIQWGFAGPGMSRGLSFQQSRLVALSVSPKEPVDAQVFGHVLLAFLQLGQCKGLTTLIAFEFPHFLTEMSASNPYSSASEHHPRVRARRRGNALSSALREFVLCNFSPIWLLKDVVQGVYAVDKEDNHRFLDVLCLVKIG